ncbi:MAG: Hpt domain-containing protein, partial [Burkholderiaceae bacterium]
AVARRDFPRAARVAHNIRGSAFYIQCDPMADDAGELEKACDAKDACAVEARWAALRGSIHDWMAAN